MFDNEVGRLSDSDSDDLPEAPSSEEERESAQVRAEQRGGVLMSLFGEAMAQKEKETEKISEEDREPNERGDVDSAEEFADLIEEDGGEQEEGGTDDSDGDIGEFVEEEDDVDSAVEFAEHSGEEDGEQDEDDAGKDVVGLGKRLDDWLEENDEDAANLDGEANGDSDESELDGETRGESNNDQVNDLGGGAAECEDGDSSSGTGDSDSIWFEESSEVEVEDDGARQADARIDKVRDELSREAIEDEHRTDEQEREV